MPTLTLAPVTSLADLDPNGTYSYADYLSWKFEELVELWQGKIMRRMSAPTDQHQAIVGELFARLHIYLRKQPCQVRVAPYDVRLPQAGSRADQAIYTVVQPDICVVCDPGKLEPRGCLGAPDLIIEVLSPGTAARDWKGKYDLYEEAGVGEYWIVAPLEQDITVFERDAATGCYRLAGEYGGPGPVPSPTLTNLGLHWEDIFAVGRA
ncbi:MAG: Uma2 family endonuclease [Janthinobacterium lividum]